MTDEEIIEMVKQTDLLGIIDSQYYENEKWVSDVVEFAKLVAEKEREACDAICLEVYEWAEKLLEKDDKHFAGRVRAAQDIGNAIRARGQE